MSYLENHNTLIMPFGRHRGWPLDCIPTSYLAWLNRQPWTYGLLKAAVREVLRQRFNEPRWALKQQPGMAVFKQQQPVDEGHYNLMDRRDVWN